MRTVNFLICLSLLFFCIIGAFLVLATPKEYGYQLYGFCILIFAWIITILYPKASFYPHNMESLPKGCIYHILEKKQVGEIYIFKLVGFYKDRFTEKKWTLIQDKNIETSFFQIDENGEFQSVP